MKRFVMEMMTLTALVSTLTGCVTQSGRPDNTGTGALIGGATGAGIGALADRRNPGAGALIGGAAGLIAGGLIGHSVDQDNEARRRAYATPPPTYTPPPPTQALSIADIKALAKAGVSDDNIITQIVTTHSVYQLDSDAIIDLSNSGVSQRVISQMLNTANSVAAQAPPAPPVETVMVAPGPDYTWVGGEWVWNGATWVWISGRWVLGPYPRAVWISARWEFGPRGWHRVPGHWR